MSSSPTTPLVSIMMTTFNRENLIVEAIKSVLGQTYQNWELLILDDASTDNTSKVVDGFAFHDQRIKYLPTPQNLGITKNRNRGLKLANGKYIAVLDSDDVWIDSTKLAEQVTAFAGDPSLVVAGTFTKLIKEDGVPFQDYTFATTDQKIRQKILVRNQFTHSSVMMSADAITKTKGYQPLLAEDLELFLQLGKYGTFCNLPIFATAHRVHGNSANDHGIKMSTAVHTIIKRHRKNYPNYYKALLISYIRLLKNTI